MENFRGKALLGEWWEAEGSDDRYKGVLQLDEEHHGTLTLRGTEAQLTSLPCHPVPRTIFGRLQNEYTHEVTLFNAGLRRGPGATYPKQPDRETSAEFYTNNILIGAHIKSEEQPFLHGALLHLTGLEEWCDTSGFLGKIEYKAPKELASESVTVSFQANSSPHYNLGDGILLRFLSQYRGPFVFEHSKRIDLAERNSIELVFSDAISINKILFEMTIWQTFITIGLRRPSYIDEVMLLIHSGRESFTSLGLIVPGRKPEPPYTRRNPRQVLFNQSKLGPNIASYLEAWRQRQNDLEIAVLLFSGTTYRDAVYTHANLLTYLQALEILHRETLKRHRFPTAETRKATIRALRAAVPTTLDETLQTQIKEQLSYIGSLTLLDRLTHLFSLYPKSLKPLFRGGDADMKSLKDARNFLTHYSEQTLLGKDFLWSRAIFVLKEKARIFLEICLLGAIGMSDDEIVELIEQFEPYLYWRMETSMDIANEMLRAHEGPHEAC